VNPHNTPIVRLIAVKNAAMARILAAKTAAMKYPAIKVLVPVLLFLLASACTSVVNEIVQDLWAMTTSNRQEFLKLITDLF
jgi:uncharacterized membrane protein (DUF106 family)